MLPRPRIVAFTLSILLVAATSARAQASGTIPAQERRVRAFVDHLTLTDGIAPACWKLRSQAQHSRELDDAQADLEQKFQDAVSRQDQQAIQQTMDRQKRILKLQQDYENQVSELSADLKQVSGGELTGHFELVSKSTPVRIVDVKIATRDTAIRSRSALDADGRGGRVVIELNGLGACQASQGLLEQALPAIELQFERPATQKAALARDAATLYFSSAPAAPW